MGPYGLRDPSKGPTGVPCRRDLQGSLSPSNRVAAGWVWGVLAVGCDWFAVWRLLLAVGVLLLAVGVCCLGVAARWRFLVVLSVLLALVGLLVGALLVPSRRPLACFVPQFIGKKGQRQWHKLESARPVAVRARGV